MPKVEFANNPSLVSNWDTYQRIADFEDGAVARVVQYLAPYRSEGDGTREGEINFQERKRRLYHVNGVDVYLTIHAAHMAQPIELSGIETPDRLLEIKDDVTGFGLDYLQAQRKRLRLYMRDGRVGTLVDGPKTTSRNQADAVAAGERSYQIIYPATKIRDWSYFKAGAFKGKLRTLVLQEDPVEFKGKLYASYRRFEMPLAGGMVRYMVLRDLRELEDGDAVDDKKHEYEVIDAGQGGTDYVPFVMWGNGPCDSFISDVWPLDLAIMNLTSVLSNVLYNQGFAKMIMTGVKREEVGKLTEYTITVLDEPGARVYSIDPGNPEGLFKEIELLKKERHSRGMFRFNHTAEDSRQQQSAEAKSKDLLQQKVLYDETLDGSTKMETAIWRIHADLENAPVDGISVSIGREYGLEDPAEVEQELLSTELLADKLGVVEVLREIMKVRLSKIRLIPGENETEDDLRQKLYKIVEKADPTPVAPPSMVPLGKNLLPKLE